MPFAVPATFTRTVYSPGFIDSARLTSFSPENYRDESIKHFSPVLAQNQASAVCL
jgi:hypothetical protein